MLAEDSLNCDTAVSVSAPSVPHRGFLVEFLHIHFQERFMRGHLNTPATPQSFRPAPASQPQDESE